MLQDNTTLKIIKLDRLLLQRCPATENIIFHGYRNSRHPEEFYRQLNRIFRLRPAVNLAPLWGLVGNKPALKIQRIKENQKS